MPKFITSHLPLTIFLTLYALIIGFKLISHPMPFYDWDESIYMEVGRETVQAKSLIPLWQGEAWLEKPPLAPIAYGIISSLPIQPEISTRIFSLLMSVIALILIYMWAWRITKNKTISFVVTFMTALNPLFLHRAQIVNTDTLLLIGWFGYLLFYPRFWLGLMFLAIGVGSKSILGFYPLILLGVFEFYHLVTRQHKTKAYIATLKSMLAQVGIISIWFIIMYLMFGQYFVQVHFYEHLVRRVTASIESHFGQRTFYLDIIFNQFNVLLIMLIPSLILIVKRFYQKKISDIDVLMSLFLIPWFIFLNLTKTKISWYAYPVIPQFTFLIVYPLTAIKNSKPLLYIISLLFMGFLLYQALVTYNFFGTFYSSYDNQYKIAAVARTRCNTLDILIDTDGRKTYEVLKGMNLTISTSTWYGNHPAMVYYFGKKVNFVYDKKMLQTKLPVIPNSECIVINKDDADLPLKTAKFDQVAQSGEVLLFQKSTH